MFRELNFQTKVFDMLDKYLATLSYEKEAVQESIDAAVMDPEKAKYIPDYPEFAFKKLKNEKHLPSSRNHTPFSPRKDSVGRPVPNITLKVPTAGGKTWLAVKSASKILNNYLGQNYGFILWIVPSEAIYTQTLENFKDRTHPYRQALDRAAAGRVKILTKNDSLNARDIGSNLCVMVLMLQSANRRSKEVLKIFKDRHNVKGFVPSAAEVEEHRVIIKSFGGVEYIKKNKNLDIYGDKLFPIVMDSLGNALRMIKPVVVMDEGHKAIAAQAYETLYGFNPSFVLELTATPKDILPRGGKNPQAARYANLLVEITGLELEAEGMIKMPLTLDPRKRTDWKATLNAAVDKLDILQMEADAFRANENRYIRPILLVQVERTGKDQRDGTRIHSEDARDWLLQTGFTTEQVAIKTADQNDLKEEKNKDLLSPFNEVRVIITKEALQEGWDCPFAYVLCSLAPRSNLSAMTQLVGRILRQPQAMKTGVDALDKSYVFTHQTETRDLLEAIKNGLESNGLGDLVLEVVTESGDGAGAMTRTIKRREKFKNLDIHLPKILVDRDGVMGSLNYETDILAKINWHDFDPSPIAETLHLDDAPSSGHIVEFGLNKDGDTAFLSTMLERLPELTCFDTVLAVQKISDIVLNRFVAREIVSKLITALESKGYDEQTLGSKSLRIIDGLRKGLQIEQDCQAEAYFKKSVKNGGIQFRLRADGNNWKMPRAMMINQAEESRLLVDHDGVPVKTSLFEQVYRAEFNNEEREVAVFLDEQKTLGWWHRNIAKKHYGLQGWRKGSIYPDFIFSVAPDGQTSKLVALEMKGEHLAGNEDTQYKEDVMKFLTENFDWDSTQSVGEFKVTTNDASVVCDLILLEDWDNNLPSRYFSK